MQQTGFGGAKRFFTFLFKKTGDGNSCLGFDLLVKVLKTPTQGFG